MTPFGKLCIICAGRTSCSWDPFPCKRLAVGFRMNGFGGFSRTNTYVAQASSRPTEDVYIDMQGRPGTPLWAGTFWLWWRMRLAKMSCLVPGLPLVWDVGSSSPFQVKKVNTYSSWIGLTISNPRHVSKQQQQNIAHSTWETNGVDCVFNTTTRGEGHISSGDTPIIPLRQVCWHTA